MTTLSIHNPTHRAIWGQCLGDSISSYLQGHLPASVTWQQVLQEQNLPYKRGQLSTYAKQMLLLVELRCKYPTISKNEFTSMALDSLTKNSSHTLLCRALKEQQPFDLPDLEMAVRVGPLATYYTDGFEMLDQVYAITKHFSTHPHALVGTLLFAAKCWNSVQNSPRSTDDLFHFARNWGAKTDIPSETWWLFEQAVRILEQGYPMQEMLDFVNIINQHPKDTLPSPRQSLTMIPLLFNGTEASFDWTQLLDIGGDLEIILNLKGCLLGLHQEIPTWMARSLSHLKVLSNYPIQHVDTQPTQLPLFDL